ncbi:MAG: hypothetical protein ABIJ46_04030 [bacterium]
MHGAIILLAIFLLLTPLGVWIICRLITEPLLAAEWTLRQDLAGLGRRAVKTGDSELATDVMRILRMQGWQPENIFAGGPDMAKDLRTLAAPGRDDSRTRRNKNHLASKRK